MQLRGRSHFGNTTALNISRAKTLRRCRLSNESGSTNAIPKSQTTATTSDHRSGRPINTRRVVTPRRQHIRATESYLAFGTY